MIDDHADIIRVDVATNCRRSFGYWTVHRSLCLSRFWKLDEDGIYLIALNSTNPDILLNQQSEV
jgi:hypothetical protein